MRVLVCGDRNWSDRDFIYATLDSWHSIESIEVLIEGEARGADSIARDWAETRGVFVEKYPADWTRHGKAAGPIRNQEMLDAKPDLVIAFHDHFDESRGTKDMVTRARKAGVTARVVSR